MFSDIRELAELAEGMRKQSFWYLNVQLVVIMVHNSRKNTK
jgi:hypothetical protein